MKPVLIGADCRPRHADGCIWPKAAFEQDVFDLQSTPVGRLTDTSMFMARRALSSGRTPHLEEAPWLPQPRT